MLVKLVPIIQENEEHKCKRFMVGLNFRIKVHLAWASQNNLGELVEAALVRKDSFSSNSGAARQ